MEESSIVTLGKICYFRRRTPGFFETTEDEAGLV
jgi:hypothetical protein